MCKTVDKYNLELFAFIIVRHINRGDISGCEREQNAPKEIVNTAGGENAEKSEKKTKRKEKVTMSREWV